MAVTPNDPLHKALSYAIEQLPHLEPCFLDGRIKFDNNLTENAIRPAKLGHKNWMFIGGEHTGWRSAVIYIPQARDRADPASRQGPLRLLPMGLRQADARSRTRRTPGPSAHRLDRGPGKADQS